MVLETRRGIVAVTTEQLRDRNRAVARPSTRRHLAVAVPVVVPIVRRAVALRTTVGTTGTIRRPTALIHVGRAQVARPVRTGGAGLLLGAATTRGHAHVGDLVADLTGTAGDHSARLAGTALARLRSVAVRTIVTVRVHRTLRRSRGAVGIVSVDEPVGVIVPVVRAVAKGLGLGLEGPIPVVVLGAGTDVTRGRGRRSVGRRTAPEEAGRQVRRGAVLEGRSVPGDTSRRLHAFCVRGRTVATVGNPGLNALTVDRPVRGARVVVGTVHALVALAGEAHRTIRIRGTAQARTGRHPRDVRTHTAGAVVVIVTAEGVGAGRVHASVIHGVVGGTGVAVVAVENRTDVRGANFVGTTVGVHETLLAGTRRRGRGLGTEQAVLARSRGRRGVATVGNGLVHAPHRPDGVRGAGVAIVAAGAGVGGIIAVLGSEAGTGAALAGTGDHVAGLGTVAEEAVTAVRVRETADAAIARLVAHLGGGTRRRGHLAGTSGGGRPHAGGAPVAEEAIGPAVRVGEALTADPLVDIAIAVVVDTVADLGGAGVDVRVVIVTVRRPIDDGSIVAVVVVVRLIRRTVAVAVDGVLVIADVDTDSARNVDEVGTASREARGEQEGEERQTESLGLRHGDLQSKPASRKMLTSYKFWRPGMELHNRGALSQAPRVVGQLGSHPQSLVFL